MSGKKPIKKEKNYIVLKMFLITLIVSTGVSLISELFLSDLGIGLSTVVLIVLILIGIVFDIIGTAFASCEQTPFIAMSSRKIKKAVHALKLLKKADIVANVCNDVIGDVCGIVSGAAGAAIVAKILMKAKSASELALGIGMSGIVAALTVAGKAMGKGYAMKNNVRIVEAIGGIMCFFSGKDKKEKKNGKAKG